LHLLVLVTIFGEVLAGPVTAQTFTVLHSFMGSEGAIPFSGLVLSGSTLYGTTQGGGNSGKGTVFALNIDGSVFTNLHHFTGGNDGAYPYAHLVLSGNSLYGASDSGGNSGSGTIFKLNIDGSGFTVLHSFTAVDPHNGTNSDGANPLGGLVLSGNTLYG